MATNFGDTIFEGELTPEVPIVQPVDNKAGEYLATGLANTVQNFNSTVFSADAKASRAAGKQNSAFAEYAEEVSLIADAKDQGKLKTDEAQRRLRVLQNEFVSNYPGMTDDFFTFSNKLMTENGLGGSIHKETPIETGLRKKAEQATAEGWDVSTPQGMAQYDKLLNSKQYLQQVETEIGMIQAEGKILTAQTVSKATLALHSVVADALPWVNQQIQKANLQLQTVQDPAQRQAIIDQTKMAIAQQTAIIGDLKSKSGGAVDTSYLTEGANELVKLFEGTATGTTTIAAYDNAQKLLEAKYNAIIFADPKLAPLLILDKTSRFQSPEGIMALDKAKLDMAAKLNQQPTTNPDGSVTYDSKPPDVVDKAENVALVFDGLKKTTAAMVADGTTTPEESEAQANKIVNTLKSVVTYGAGDQDATNFTAVVDFLADSSVGKFMEKNAGAINPEIAKQAKYVTHQQYENVVLPLINERWLEAQTQIVKGQPGLSKSDMFSSGIGLSSTNLDKMETVDINAAIEPVWNGAGIQFEVTEEYRDNAAVRSVAKDLNTGPNAAAPAINKLVRLSAHLSGNTDYKKMYDEAYATRLWQKPEEEDKTPAPEAGTNGKFLSDSMKEGMPMQVDNPADLELADFSDEELQKIVQSSKAKEPEKLLSANTPLAAAQAYLGMSESNPEQVQTLSRFIKNSTGIDINPAKTAWCAAFVDAVLGGKGTGKLNARSYLMWGKDVSDSPQPGDVVVLQRGDKDGWQGHVGFYMGTNPDGTIKVLGGNQGDAVAEGNFDASKVLGFRRAG